MGTVVLRDLLKVYPPNRKQPGFEAVKRINLEIRDGEFMVLVGPSGCGKSTTLRMIAGLEEITDGAVSIDGTVVNDLLPKDRGIAMVFQNYALYPHMTVFENMAFGLTLAKTPKTEIAQRVGEAARILGLDQLLDRKPAALSGGQRQRVAVGRAIVRKPKVFLFDEPLSNLDAKMRVSMRTELSKLHARLGATMVYVTHDQIEAMTMGDRICVMRDGEIMQVADPLTLYNQPDHAYVAGFIGSPPMNLVRGVLETRQGTPWFIETAAPSAEFRPMALALGGSIGPRAASAESREVIFGIRPEDISAHPADASVPLTASIDLAEPMGAETFLHLRTSANSLIARMPATQAFREGAEITVHLNLKKAHLFDAKSEKAIR